ncbi:unnamed protein product [Ceutorhynchus assimilis]|uniref:Uncharacterized protein n=1 Tax=Ceutorhynchus assimilis TaxID=467358 RepID=A0A9N9MAZ5_9CUCU|nr:unnamed protein product [Ceutorhynchus assimilis]
MVINLQSKPSSLHDPSGLKKNHPHMLKKSQKNSKKLCALIKLCTQLIEVLMNLQNEGQPLTTRQSRKKLQKTTPIC